MADQPSAQGTRADQAMNHVLEAERAARDQAVRCEAEAATLVEQARQQARRIAARTDARLTHIHTSCGLATARQIEALLRQETSESEIGVGTPQEQELLQAAVDRLAARLTGGD